VEDCRGEKEKKEGRKEENVSSTEAGRSRRQDDHHTLKSARYFSTGLVWYSSYIRPQIPRKKLAEMRHSCGERRRTGGET